MNSSAPHILFTDDHADTRELLWYLLTRNNCRVTLADCNERALLLARINSFDLYIIDNWMPGGSGIELCMKIRKFDSTTPILFYSGAAYETDKQEAFAAGAQAYLTKPADNDELVVTVFNLIAAAGNNNPSRESSRALLGFDKRFDYEDAALTSST